MSDKRWFKAKEPMRVFEFTGNEYTGFFVDGERHNSIRKDQYILDDMFRPGLFEEVADEKGTPISGGEAKIPTREQNPIGLHRRYRVEKVYGKNDPRAIHIVLRIDRYGNDRKWVDACQGAIVHLARRLVREDHLKEVAIDLLQIVAKESGDLDLANPEVHSAPAASEGKQLPDGWLQTEVDRTQRQAEIIDEAERKLADTPPVVPASQQEAELTAEQMCRNLLDCAIRDGIVTFNAEDFESTPDPQSLTAGDICGMANLLCEYLRRPPSDTQADPLPASPQEAEEVISVEEAFSTLDAIDRWVLPYPFNPGTNGKKVKAFIADTQAELEKLQKENAVLNRNVTSWQKRFDVLCRQRPLCPDCRDKCKDYHCLRCEIQSLENEVASLQSKLSQAQGELRIADYRADTAVKMLREFEGRAEREQNLFVAACACAFSGNDEAQAVTELAEYLAKHYPSSDFPSQLPLGQENEALRNQVKQLQGEVEQVNRLLSLRMGVDRHYVMRNGGRVKIIAHKVDNNYFCPWVGDNGITYNDNGRVYAGDCRETGLDIVEFLPSPLMYKPPSPAEARVRDATEELFDTIENILVGKSGLKPHAMVTELRKRFATLTEELRKAREENGELHDDIDHAQREGKRYCPDYPWNQNDAKEVAWALGQGYLGVKAANDDLHKRIAVLEADLARIGYRTADGVWVKQDAEVFHQSSSNRNFILGSRAYWCIAEGIEFYSTREAARTQEAAQAAARSGGEKLA